VESMEEFTSKVSAARAAVGAADFFLIARTDARNTSAKHGLADAITRANLYVDAGADASLVEGPRSTYELQTIADNTIGWKAVSISEGGHTPAHSYQQLKEMGFQLVRSMRALSNQLLPALSKRRPDVRANNASVLDQPPSQVQRPRPLEWAPSPMNPSQVAGLLCTHT
jgi:2-methylisocitrate lyase-like PEP mutase family enzyme